MLPSVYSQIYTGRLGPHAETVAYVEQTPEGESNGGFASLGFTQQEFVISINPLLNFWQHCRILIPEILNLLFSNSSALLKTPHPLWEMLYSEHQKALSTLLLCPTDFINGFFTHHFINRSKRRKDHAKRKR